MYFKLVVFLVCLAFIANASVIADEEQGKFEKMLKFIIFCMCCCCCYYYYRIRQ